MVKPDPLMHPHNCGVSARTTEDVLLVPPSDQSRLMMGSEKVAQVVGMHFATMLPSDITYHWCLLGKARAHMQQCHHHKRMCGVLHTRWASQYRRISCGSSLWKDE